MGQTLTQMCTRINLSYECTHVHITLLTIYNFFNVHIQQRSDIMLLYAQTAMSYALLQEMNITKAALPILTKWCQ